MSNKNRLTSTGCVTLRYDPMIKRHPGPYSIKSSQEASLDDTLHKYKVAIGQHNG